MLFLIAVFMAFIDYGLTGSLFSSVWSQIALDINVDYSLLGVLTMISSGTSGLSSAFAYVLRRRLGTSKSIIVSFIGFTISLLLFYSANNIIMICIALAFLGFSSGIIDTVINSYIIKAYDSGKLSLLHASWGLGSTIGPILMSIAITKALNYRLGFLWSTILIVIGIFIFVFLKIYWENIKKNLDKDFVNLHSVSQEEKQSNISLVDIFKIENGLNFVLCFILCGAVNSSLSAWIATLTVNQRNLSVEIGAAAATFYFAGLTATRVLLSFLSKKIGNHNILYGGFIISIISYILLFVKTSDTTFVYFDAALIGIGISPLIPFLHSSVKEFFDEKHIGVIVSGCNSLSLASSALSTALITLLIKLIGVNNVQILFITFIAVALILYSNIIKKHSMTK